jgi:UDPglucose 6-dehydrogenase
MWDLRLDLFDDRPEDRVRREFQREGQSMRITVVGTGYLGATHAACMAELGFHVLGMDSDQEKVAALSAGAPPFYEPGLSELIAKQIAAGRLRFTTSYREVAQFTDDDPTVHFLCVGTPQLDETGATDLRFLEQAVDGLAAHIDERCLVVGKSTVPVGTAERLGHRLDAELAWNPEFLREGFAIRDTLKPNRLVFGVRSHRAEALLRRVYRSMLTQDVPVVVTDLATAQLAKLAANAFLSTKISFINAMAEICEATGGDAVHVGQVLGYDNRIGRQFLTPGIGFGGGCLPKDIAAFMARAEELGMAGSTAFLREVERVNSRCRSRMVELAREQCGGTFRGKHVTVWGAAFKPCSDDIRDSPALTIADEIHRQGARVTVYDPKATDNARKAFPTLNYADSATEAAVHAHVVLHLTEWPEFQDIDLSAVGNVVTDRRIVDGRNALDAERWRSAGWVFRSIGRPEALERVAGTE